MDRVVRVVGHDGSATLYEYDAIGNRTAVRHEGGLTVRYQYDSCSRLVNETVTDKDSNVLIYYDYSYGNAGEKIRAVEIARSSKDDTDVRVIKNTYTYDNLLRLTGEKTEAAENVPFTDVFVSSNNGNTGNNSGNTGSNNGNSGNETPVLTADISEVVFEGNIENQYTFDAVSNRTKKVTVITTAVSGGDVCGLAENTEAGTTDYTYNALNQLTSAVSGETTVNYTYDLNGNLVAEHGGSEDKTYTYDADNRLITATVSSGNNVTIESYTYDYEGNRVSKQTNEDGRIYYLNDDAYAYTQVSLELKKAQDNSYVINKYYTRGTELLSADILEAGSYVKKLYIMDGHGSVTALAENVPETGNSGNPETSEEGYIQELTDTYVYDAYGNLLKQAGDTDNDYLYTGEQYNETTGLYYLRARYMSPETGTFVSMDSYAGTLDNPVSLHKYLYADANPVMYVDPSGNFSLMETNIAQGIQATINADETDICGRS